MGINRWLSRKAAKQITSKRVREIYASYKYTTLETFLKELSRLIEYRELEGERELVAALRFEQSVVHEMSLDILTRINAGEWHLMGETITESMDLQKRIPGSILPSAPWRV